MQKSKNTLYFNHVKRIDGTQGVSYGLKYICKPPSKGHLSLSKKEIYNVCLDLMKKIKNANCNDKFYIA